MVRPDWLQGAFAAVAVACDGVPVVSVSGLIYLPQSAVPDTTAQYNWSSWLRILEHCSKVVLDAGSGDAKAIVVHSK